MTDLTPFEVPCSACGRVHLVDPTLLRPGGVVGCRVCGARFTVYPPGARPEPRPQPPPAPPRALAVQLAWIFPDDVALEKRGVLQCIRSEFTGCRTRMLDEAARAAFQEESKGPDWATIFEIGGCLGDSPESPTGTPDWPQILVFGDMHVLREDRLLQTVATRAGVHRILVSTHRNPDMILQVQEFCGFDRQLVLPISRADVRAALEPAHRHP